MSRENEKKDIGEQKLVVNKNHPFGLWSIDLKLENDRRQLPVFDCREESHKEPVAQLLASYNIAAAFGVGLYGFSALVEDPRVGKHPDSWKAFYQAKIGRSLDKKIPIQTTPKNMFRYMNKNIIHPEFRRYFESRESAEELYEKGVALHIMSPIPNDAHYIHPVFIMNHKVFLEDGTVVEMPVVSLFNWYDPDWYEISDRIGVYNPHATPGISSANASGQAPAYDFYGITKFITDNEAAPFDLAIRDSENEGKGVRSSHPQFRPAFVGEKPEWVVIREGAMSTEGFLHAINSPFRARKLDTTTLADRDHSDEEVLDESVLKVKNDTDKSYTERHPKGTLTQEIRKKLNFTRKPKSTVLQYIEENMR